MKIEITTLEGAEAGSLELDEAIFGLEPRADLLQPLRALAARQAPGWHPPDQAARRDRPDDQEAVQAEGHRQRPPRRGLAPQFRGGARAHGPQTRSHAHDLPKKVRALALRHALSAKAKGSALVVVDDVRLDEGKTKVLKERFGKLGLSNALIIGGAEVDENFARSARNLPHIDVLPVQGINVYDILRREKLVLTRAAVDALEARFK